MKKTTLAIFAVLLMGAGMNVYAEKTAAELEKEKAMKEPFANDLGPSTLDAKYLKTLSAAAQKGYKALQAKCTACHEANRPLNAQFVETAGKKKADRVKAAAALKKSKPELFKDKNTWKIEGAIWQRYVKRMMSKPGCEVTKAEGKVIWKFLSEDSRKRKLGKAAEWTAARKKMLEEFKEQHPKRYSVLYGGGH
jgi:cytochrome c1